MDDDDFDAANFRQRADDLRAERRAMARQMRAAGMSVRAIAERLGVSHPTVIEDLRAESAASAAAEFDAMLREAMNRNVIRGDQVVDDDMLHRATPGGMVTQDVPPREPTVAEQMDAWLRSPAARRGARLTGRTATDDFIHGLYERADARHRLNGDDQ